MKNKPKKIFKNFTWWLGVVVIGVSLGLGLQFVRAWTEPTVAPPGGNVGAPINTSINDQTKGNATQGKINAADFCLNSDPTKCLSTAGGGGGGGIFCGNGTCEATETCSNCPIDCGSCPPPPPPPCQCETYGYYFSCGETITTSYLCCGGDNDPSCSHPCDSMCVGSIWVPLSCSCY